MNDERVELARVSVDTIRKWRLDGIAEMDRNGVDPSSLHSFTVRSILGDLLAHYDALTARAEAAERALRDARENERLAIRDFSDLLTSGNAGTWGQLYHAARELQAELTDARHAHAQLVAEGERTREALEALRCDGDHFGCGPSDECFGTCAQANAALTPPRPGKG